MTRRRALAVLVLGTATAACRPAGEPASPPRTLRIALRADVTGFFPGPLVNEAFTLQVNRSVYESLVRFDRDLRLRPALAERWSTDPRLVFACGRYEGIDSRVVPWARTLTAAGQPVAVEEVSIGDYVLAGAEAAVLVMVEAVGRLIPGVLGNEASHADDSFATGGMEGLLEGPIYTRPPVWEGMAVPEVLTSGDHGAVARWRHEQALERTREMRPDLLS
jgi:tRNA (guanine-N1)-methyltransferase